MSEIHLNQSVNYLSTEKKRDWKIKNPKTFTDYSEKDDDVYENLEVQKKYW